MPAGAVCELPRYVPTSVGVVLPLGISTASAGLFQKGFLALPLPGLDVKKTVPSMPSLPLSIMRNGPEAPPSLQVPTREEVYALARERVARELSPPTERRDQIQYEDLIRGVVVMILLERCNTTHSLIPQVPAAQQCLTGITDLLRELHVNELGGNFRLPVDGLQSFEEYGKKIHSLLKTQTAQVGFFLGRLQRELFTQDGQDAKRVDSSLTSHAAPNMNTVSGISAGRHALQDFQMQLMLLEQQNKKRLLMARQEQGNMSYGQKQAASGPMESSMKLLQLDEQNGKYIHDTIQRLEPARHKMESASLPLQPATAPIEPRAQNLTTEERNRQRLRAVRKKQESMSQATTATLNEGALDAQAVAIEKAAPLRIGLPDAVCCEEQYQQDLGLTGHKTPEVFHPVVPDWKTQAVLLERQNERRLLAARQESENRERVASMRDFVEQTHGQMQDVASHRKETRTVYPHDAQRRDDRMNSAAQDYERQLQLLEMQNKQRLDMARSEENQTIAGAPPSRTAYPLLPIRGKPSEVNAQPETAMPDIGPPQTSPAALEAQERRYHQNVLAQQNMKRKFYESQQALATPSPQSRRVLLVWGGSSSVGSCAIQLASFSGVEVYTTASAHNFAYCEKLGAAKCFDYHDPDVEDKIVEALKGKTVAGAYHAVGGNDAVQTCARIMDRASGKAIVVTVRGVPERGIPSSVRVKSSKPPSFL